MKNFLILSMISFILLHCKNLYLFLAFVFIIYLYKEKYHKINNRQIILILLIYFNSLHNLSVFNNIVLETHESYVIASVDYHKVLIYTDEVYFFGERVIVDETSKSIDSNSNFYLFDFKQYMKQKNITISYDNENVKIIKRKSIQRTVYEYICNLNENISSTLLKIFYQFDTDNYLITSTGMHFSYLNQLFNSTFNIYTSNFLLILFGLLFPFDFSLFRIFISNILKMNKNLSLKDRIGIQYLICMFIFPSSIYSLNFVLPFILNLISIFISDNKYRKLIQFILTIFVQFKYFNQCQLFNTFLFSLSRKVNAFLLVIGLIQLMIPNISFITFFYNLFDSIILLFNKFTLYGHISFMISLLFIYFFINSMHQKRYSIICLLILIYIPNQAKFNPFYSVDFINVGQGDSALIRAPFDLYNVLIDIPLNKEDEVIDYLHALGINKIDSLIFTHEDSDHSGGKENFIEQFKVDNIIEEHIDIKNKYLYFISLNESNYDNENNNSLVYYVKVGSLNYCFMADVSKDVELDILDKYDLNCDVIKIGHHGSSTSTHPLFIQKINPQIAIISAGKNNIYGHPHDSVIETLQNYNVSTFQTAIHGSISIKNFLLFNFITTSSKEFGIIIAE